MTFLLCLLHKALFIIYSVVKLHKSAGEFVRFGQIFILI